MDVKDGQDVKKDIIGYPAPGLMEGLEIGDQVPVSDLRTFRTSGGAAGVDDDGRILRIIGGRVRLSVLCAARIETTILVIGN